MEGDRSRSRLYPGSRNRVGRQVRRAKDEEQPTRYSHEPTCAEAFHAQLGRCRQRSSEDLLFTTRNQTPLNPKNLLRRVLRPACKALGLPLISWRSFRHTHATQLAEVGESIRTAQALLGHSDLETTLNVYTHAIPEAQRRAVDKIAEVLFTNVQNISVATENEKVN